MKTSLLVLFFMSMNLSAAENGFIPMNLLKTDKYFSHHVLIAEKSTHSLYLFENDGSSVHLVKTYQIATGKLSGDKFKEGDFKTPEGIYDFESFMNKKELMSKIGQQAKIYGAGAFVSNYPNEYDRILGKKGSGIWLHSTNDETRIEKGLDSRGCAVMVNNDLKEVAKYIELNKTPFIITQNLKYFSKETNGETAKEIEEILGQWKDSWEKKNLSQYFSFYDQANFRDPKGNFKKYKEHKENIFSNASSIKVEISNLTLLENESYVKAIFVQKYTSNGLSDIGKKTIYFSKDANDDWKIISENWETVGIDEHLAKNFIANNKYFN